MTHNARYPDLLDFIVKGTHQSCGTRLCSCFHALWNCTQPFIPTSSNQSKNPEHQQVSTDHHSRSSGYTPLEMGFWLTTTRHRSCLWLKLQHLCSTLEQKGTLSRVNDVRSNGVSHPAMAPSTNSCKYKKMHHCKFAHNQQLETPNSHHSTGCPVNPLSFHQKTQGLVAPPATSNQSGTVAPRLWHAVNTLNSLWWLQTKTPSLFQFMYQYKCVESRRHNLPPWSLANLSGWLGVFGVFAFLFAGLNLFHVWHGSTQSVSYIQQWFGKPSYSTTVFVKTRSQSCKTLRAVESQIIPTPKHQQKPEKSQPTEWQKG